MRIDNIEQRLEIAQEMKIQIVLEHFERNEICNSDWLELEWANIKRAEDILRDFSPSSKNELYKYLTKTYPQWLN